MTLIYFSVYELLAIAAAIALIVTLIIYFIKRKDEREINKLTSIGVLQIDTYILKCRNEQLQRYYAEKQKNMEFRKKYTGAHIDTWYCDAEYALEQYKDFDAKLKENKDSQIRYMYIFYDELPEIIYNFIVANQCPDLSGLSAKDKDLYNYCIETYYLNEKIIEKVEDHIDDYIKKIVRHELYK